MSLELRTRSTASHSEEIDSRNSVNLSRNKTQSDPRPERLPRHETAFALTVHKSQGSEFDTVLLMLSDRMAPVLTRELIYTGLTRAKSRAEIWCPEEILGEAIRARVHRMSGLRDLLSAVR